MLAFVVALIACVVVLVAVNVRDGLGRGTSESEPDDRRDWEDGEA